MKHCNELVNCYK